MKIQIDTDKKVLRLEADINLGELILKIKKLFPNGEWKEYKLETNVEIQWTNPIYIDRWSYPTYPWWQPSITYITDGSDLVWVDAPNTDYTIVSHVYNVEV